MLSDVGKATMRKRTMDRGRKTIQVLSDPAGHAFTRFVKQEFFNLRFRYQTVRHSNLM